MYYNGNVGTSTCTHVITGGDVLTVQEIFETLQALTSSTEIPSNTLETCGYIPIVPDKNNGLFSHSINLKEFAATGKGSFSLSQDPQWLKENGWDDLFQGINSKANFYIEKAQVPLPYASSSCGSISSSIEVDGAYVTRRSANAPEAVYEAGSRALKLPFSYSDATKSKYGSVETYEPYNTSPPLPSVFSSMSLITTPECLSFPGKFGDRKRVIFANNTEVTEDSLETSLKIPMCLKLRVTGQFNVYRGPSSLESPKCNICPAGQFQANQLSDRMSCKSCPAGTYQPGKGFFTCLQCPQGTYQDKTGQTKCATCPKGTCCKVEGMTSPKKC
eukprot:Nk52_evm11s326 gene=Nk52_evmTU11s326